MKHIIAAIALLAASTMPALAGEATASTAPQLDRTQEYRMWSAEQMLERVTNKMAKMVAVCNQTEVKAAPGGLSEACMNSVINAYPRLATIREIAASGDEVQWAILVEATHKMEKGIEPALNDLERK